MCGIAGFTWNDSELIKKMLSILKHRGPDDEGIYEENGITLGHRRLAILDLSEEGHQPMVLDGGRLVIVHNGEIYNYKELKKELEKKGRKFRSETDTEVILHAYDEWGEKCVKKFNGMWAFVIYDREKKVLFISRDRFGIKPLYFYKIKGKGLIFASEIKAILPYKDRWHPNDRAIFDYLLYNITDHENFTFFKGIEKFPKAHYAFFELKTNKFTFKRYWDLPERKNKGNVNYNEIRKLLENSVRLRLRSDVPVGSCLSGGLDSSSIVSLMHKVIGNKSNISTFSAVYPGYEKNEEKYIDLLINYLKIKNMKITPTAEMLMKDLKKFLYYLEEPPRSTSSFAQFNVMRLAKTSGYKVLLDGQGSDEIFGGYSYFYGYYIYNLFKNKKIFKLLRLLLYCKKNNIKIKWINTFLFLAAPPFLKKKLIKNRSFYISNSFYREMSSKSHTFKNIFNIYNIYDVINMHIEKKLEELLKWEDRNSMAFSIEARVPFLDYLFVEYMTSLRFENMISNCYTKYPLRKAMEGIVPKDILYRKDKIGFETPQSQWLKNDEIYAFIYKIIESSKFKNRKYWNWKDVQYMLETHLKGKKDYSFHIWKVIFLEMWMRIFIDKTEKLI